MSNKPEKITGFKVTEWEYYTRSLMRPNRWGNMETACCRKVTYWNARCGDRVIEGFGTKRAAVAAMKEIVERHK